MYIRRRRNLVVFQRKLKMPSVTDIHKIWMNILNMYFLSTSCVLLLDIEDAIKNLWGVEATFLTDIELYKD